MLNAPVLKGSVRGISPNQAKKQNPNKVHRNNKIPFWIFVAEPEPE